MASVRACSCGAPSSAARHEDPSEESTPHIPPEYWTLYAYLEHRYAAVVVLTFELIEPSSDSLCRRQQEPQHEWWTTTVETRRHSVAWTEAGRTEAPSLAAGIVTFERPA